jgi:hypothetical protein
MAESCGGCKFWRPIAAGGVNACHFLLDTGIPRCYPPEECIYHTKGMENMSRGKALSPETIGQIEQMNAEGKSISQICDALSVSSATVTRVRNGKLKSPEAPTPMENASEDIKSIGNSDTNIITEVPENVKQDDYSPYESAVDDAVLERIEKIRDRITEMQFDISNYENELNVLEEFHLKYMEAQNNERSNENC